MYQWLMHALVHLISSHVHHDDAGSNESHILKFVMHKLDFRVEQCSTTTEDLISKNFEKQPFFGNPKNRGFPVLLKISKYSSDCTFVSVKS